MIIFNTLRLYLVSSKCNFPMNPHVGLLAGGRTIMISFKREKFKRESYLSCSYWSICLKKYLDSSGPQRQTDIKHEEVGKGR